MNKPNKKIIALVGLCGSGKSIAGEYLEQIGYEKVYFGGITLEEVQKRGLEINETNERLVREDLRKEMGMGAYAKLSLPKIQSALTRDNNVFIDGLYSWSEYKILKSELGDQLLVIAVFTPKSLRYKRLAMREFRPLTPQEAESRDYAEIENIEKGGPIAIADHTLINTGTPEDLINSLKPLIE